MYIVTLHQQFRPLKLYLSLDLYQLQRHVISKTYSNKIATTFKLLVMLSSLNYMPEMMFLKCLDPGWNAFQVWYMFPTNHLST